MPVMFLNTRVGGLAILHGCDVAGCTAPAVFGSNVQMRAVHKKILAKDVEGARRAAGQWHCQEHNTKQNEAQA